MKSQNLATKIFSIVFLLSSWSASAEQAKGTVLVAGATGSIGRIVIGLLNDQGYAVRA